ncbi:hypothetical protein BegalDRAFT_2041 [Beggiatoa alba B18LD]|uniref:Uncharacterized protein n=1 Tax=Beggiatoa alba B18LD TaxID=395493 RepID=I3CH14_9GAMM|nr:hypothetical protein [Beggiatoa alba]EIJ42907.1 hypothetical protein BegalDRAFT_2041 [Beggiatoa alba B18LD]
MKRLSKFHWRKWFFIAIYLLLWQPPATFAAGGYGGLDTGNIPSLSMTQLSVPASLIRPPYRNGIDNELLKELNLQEAGTLYATDASNGRIDFLISGIRNDMDMDVYLAYSTRPSSVVDLWPASFAGKMELDPLTLEIIAIVRLRPLSAAYSQATPLGVANTTTQATVISLTLSDLRLPQLQSNELYFQSLAVRAGSLDFTDSQASEVDKFIIDRTQQAIRLKQ